MLAVRQPVTLVDGGSKSTRSFASPYSVSNVTRRPFERSSASGRTGAVSIVWPDGNSVNRKLAALLQVLVEEIPGGKPVIRFRLQQQRRQRPQRLRRADHQRAGRKLPAARLALPPPRCQSVAFKWPLGMRHLTDATGFDFQLDVFAKLLHLNAVPLQILQHACELRRQQVGNRQPIIRIRLSCRGPATASTPPPTSPSLLTFLRRRRNARLDRLAPLTERPPHLTRQRLEQPPEQKRQQLPTKVRKLRITGTARCDAS